MSSLAQRMGRRTGAVAATALLAAGVARADFTWDGSGGDDLWTTGLNWVGGVAPAGVISDNIVFGPEGAGNFMVTGADGAYSDILGILFTGADGAYSISGTGSFALADGAAISNDSTFVQTIGVDIVGTGDDLLIRAISSSIIITGDIDLSDTGGVTLSFDGNGSTTVDGIISGAGGGVVKSGIGALTLNGANTHDTTELAGGVIIVGDDAALGTGVFTVSGNGSVFSDDDSRVIGNDVVIDSGIRLTVSGANDLELAGNISSDGGLIKTGTGMLTLSGTNTYTGTTEIFSGRLRVTGGDALADDGLVTLANVAGAELELLADETIGALTSGGAIGGSVLLTGADLTLAGSGASTFNGVISGSGGLVISGAGSFTFGGANTYAGGTTLTGAGATLGFNSDTAIGTGTLSIMADVTLTTTDERTISNDIVTTSDFTIAGDDTFTLLGDIDLSGLTTRIETTNARGVVLGGVISNGALTKTGDGTLTLRGINTYTGDTNVDAGELVLDGTVTGRLFVNDGGRLSGTGTLLDDLRVRSGGTFAPAGDDIGTFRVQGDFRLDPGSMFLVDINGEDATTDFLDVTGAVLLRSGSTLTADIASDDFIMAGDEFTVIQGDGGITDEGMEITTTSATLDFVLRRDSDFEDGDTLYILEAVRGPSAYEDAASGSNNEAIGAALDSLVEVANEDPDGEVADLLGQLDTFGDDQIDDAIGDLSPEVYGAFDTVVADDATAYGATQTAYLTERRRGTEGFMIQAGIEASALAGAKVDPLVLAAAIAAQDEAEKGVRDPLTIYALGVGRLGSLDTDGDRVGYTEDVYGAQGGVDLWLSNHLIAGAGVSYTIHEVDLNEDSGEIDVDMLRVGPYITAFNDDGWYLDISASFGFSDLDGDRNMPTLDRNASVDYDGDDITGYVGLGVDWNFTNSWTLSPSVAFQYSYIDFDGFTESDAGGADLRVDDRDTDSLRSRLGVSLFHHPDGGSSPLFLELSVGWQHEYLDSDDVDAVFAGGGDPFTVGTGDRDENSLFIGFGCSHLLNDTTAIYFRYDGLIGEDSYLHGLSGGVSIRF
jgi:autotransporter-associated beta strand protein